MQGGRLREAEMARAAIILLLLMLVPSAALAEAEKRVALLIGNQGYADSVGPLRNLSNDIDGMHPRVCDARGHYDALAMRAR